MSRHKVAYALDEREFDARTGLRSTERHFSYREVYAACHAEGIGHE